jgi:hypothetical protein
MFSRYGPVQCTRTVASYLAFDGDFAARNSSWDQALQAAGWHPVTETMAMIMARYRGIPDPDATTSPTPVLASDLPSTGYQDANSTLLEIRWAERPEPPYAFQDVNDGRPAANSATTVYRQAQVVDIVAVAQQAFTAYRYLAIVTMQQMYYNEAWRSPSPTPTGPAYHPCFSGSNNCPGG